MKKLLLISAALLINAVCFAYEPMWVKFNKPFKVKGGVGIEQFAKALDLLAEDDWGESVLDKKNGYFSFFDEGDGSIRFRAAYWNRKDGKRLFIVSYQNVETAVEYVEPIVSPWGFCKMWDDADPNGCGTIQDTGFMAYLYNPSKQQLEPMATPPVRDWGQNKLRHYFLELPQHGKNITVHQEESQGESTTFVLEWTGLDFIVKTDVIAEFYRVDKEGEATNLRNAPGGKVVAKLESEGIFNFYIDKIQNGWCHIQGDKVFEMSEDDPRILSGSTTGYWIHSSVVGATGMGAGGVELFAQPDKSAKVVYKSDDWTIIHPVEIKGNWIKVTVGNTKTQGWINVLDVCSNPVTNCC